MAGKGATTGYDVFISYRRDGGIDAAKHLRDVLTERGYRVFFDIEAMRGGYFNRKIYDAIDSCKDFVIVLSNGALDRCANEDDWVRLEIARALAQKKNVVPLMAAGFEFPSKLPDDIADVRFCNGVEINYRYWEAMVDRLCEFLISKPVGGWDAFLDWLSRLLKRRVAIVAVAMVAVAALAFALVQGSGGAAGKTIPAPSNTAQTERGLAPAEGTRVDLAGMVGAGETEGKRVVAIAGGLYHSAGLHADGTVTTTSEYDTYDLSGWTDVKEISACYTHTIGLRSDGTVVAKGDDYDGQCDVAGWTDVVAVSTGKRHTVSLRSDGTVAAVGSNEFGQCDVSGWTDVVMVAAGGGHTIAVREDGSLVAKGENVHGQCDVSGWSNVVGISAGSEHTVALRADGTVVACGNNEDGQCEVSGWTDVIAIATGAFHTLGLRSDGTVLATGNNADGACEVSDWSDVVAIAAGSRHTIALRSDDTMLATGMNDNGQCDVYDL